MVGGEKNMYFITIDAGTTNSRLYLINRESNQIIDKVKKEIGIRNVAIDQSIKNFQKELSHAMEELITRNSCQLDSIAYIVASGMITSNLGLVEVPYVISPCTVDDFANASVIKDIPEFFDLPCVFVPGAKNFVQEHTGQSLLENINEYDVMRGEEVEVFGLIEQLGLTGKGLVILPGSHMKYILIENETILSSLSTLSGEILSAIQKETILSNSLHKDLLKDIHVEVLLQGLKAGMSFGFSRALYQIRLLHLFDQLKENDRANYFVGLVLASDMKALNEKYGHETLDWVVVGGSNPLRKSFIHILNHFNYQNVIQATDHQVYMSTIIGGKKVGEMSINRHQNQFHNGNQSGL